MKITASMDVTKQEVLDIATHLGWDDDAPDTAADQFIRQAVNAQLSDWLMQLQMDMERQAQEETRARMYALMTERISRRIQVTQESDPALTKDEG